MNDKKHNTIIISDTHITGVFHKKRYDYLENLISRCDRLIFNGDLWSYYSLTLDDVFKSKWTGLFPLMKSKKCIFIYGNHDRKEWCDDRIFQFCDEAHNEYHYKEEGVDLLITHGHLLANDSITNETYIKFNRLVNNFNKLNQSYRFYFFLQKSLLFLMGESKYAQLFKKLNDPHINYAKGLPDKTILVAAHTHSPAFMPEKKYINVGFINFGLSFFLHIDDGKLSLESERY
ncbi:MAG TPA: metallophosphoesterase family protein [Candidatus Dojkabacteria bacterium]|mgnify:CR=1 FL=1|nr:metallophosphoesterase family protein [Candidatus Dojkabacteria bacterium]HRP37073.1 metallophosphoesterase family protein [Candidatus Dojkabacteria bacterium]HRP50671.1 metallophosphoesterase family protein [Candidatus Dojkabacteria bacterium]